MPLFPYFSVFWFSDVILSDALILPVSQLKHRIFNTDLYSCAHFVIEIDENLAVIANFNTI